MLIILQNDAEQNQLLFSSLQNFFDHHPNTKDAVEYMSLGRPTVFCSGSENLYFLHGLSSSILEFIPKNQS